MLRGLGLGLVVLDAYRRTPGLTGAVRSSARRLAAAFYERGVPISALAAVRRLFRPPLRPRLQPIRSLHCSRPVIDEVLELRISPDYFRCLQQHIDRALSERPR